MNGKADPVKRVAALLVDAFLAGLVYEIVDFFLFESLALSMAWTLLLLRDTPSPVQSPGKRLLSLVTRRTDGKPLHWKSSFKRNLPLAAGPFVYLFFLFAFALAPHFGRFLAQVLGLTTSMVVLGTEAWKIFNDPAGARLGDILAGTEVSEEF